MATVLKKFVDAYATMTVAIYEPLITKWISGWTIHTLADVIAWRSQKAKFINLNQAMSTAQAINVVTTRRRLPSAEIIQPLSAAVKPVPSVGVDLSGNLLADENVNRIQLEGYPNAVEIGGRIYPQGILNTQPDAARAAQPSGFFARLFGFASSGPRRPQGNVAVGARTLPTGLSGSLGVVDPDFDLTKARKNAFTIMLDATKKAIDSDAPLGPILATSIRNTGLYDFFPEHRIEEALSPIGVAHFYRQLYFNAEEGFGPIEEAFTIAPLETFEVVYETIRRQIHEEFIEHGSEQVSESAVETKNIEEVSDKVSSMIQRDTSTAFSANASGSVGVWEAGASASAEFQTSTQRSREEASRRLKEVTKRSSERITKTFSLKVRDVDDITNTNLTRRVIKNEAAHPVSFGLRRVLRRVHVKVQSLGPRLVWQLYIRNPGGGLARSRFVHFRVAEPISTPDLPPGMPPRPKGGTDTGTTSSDLEWEGAPINKYYASVVIQTGADREVKAVSIDSITDLEGGGKDDLAPSPLNDVQWDKNWDETTHTYTTKVAVLPGDALSVSLSYTYSWEPSQAVINEWEVERQRRVRELTQQALNEQFERERALITQQSKIRTRPPADLRREERYEVLNRMVSHLFSRGDDPSGPAPIEIEYFHRYFDIDAIFTYTHPSWWKPRYSPVATSLDRPAYEITAESEPARMGSSLGWMMQLDGDTRRNEFINSPWVRVCLPIRPGREREAIVWLAKHIEGTHGFNTNSGPLQGLLKEIEATREREKALGINGADYVSIDSTVSDEPSDPEQPLRPEGVFPIIQEFDVTVPTDGFVYDELVLVNS